MRVSSLPSAGYPPQPGVQPPAAAPMPAAPALSFLPLSADAFAQARRRHVPVFLLIAHAPSLPDDPSLRMQLMERTVPAFLRIGERPDVELLCRRAGALFSGEGALPLCALLLDDARPFLAAPLPPHGFPLDASRLYVWLAHADKRLAQNPPAMAQQAAQVIRSFRADSPARPYAPQDAAHDLARALAAAEDAHSGGFRGIKTPLVCPLCFWQHAAARGDRQAHGALNRALDAMLASALYDPLDGSFFDATLTDDWRVFVPEKPLGVNAMLALILLRDGRRSEAVRLLDQLAGGFALPGGGLSPALLAPKSTYAFTPEQACAALGNEDGLRACRLLGLLHRHARPEPAVAPSRFSPVAEPPRRALDDAPAALYPTLSPSLTPEDAAFLRRALPALLRVRQARTPQSPLQDVVAAPCALAAAVLAECGRRLGESRYTQAARRAVSFLLSQPGAPGPMPMPASVAPASPLHAQATCGASAALALALLTLGGQDEAYLHTGLRLLGGALHAFVRPDGMVMHTQDDPASFFPRTPAIYDDELPSPAALLVHALRLADGFRPEAHYTDAVETIWRAAAPAVRQQPMACAALIDAMTQG